MCSSDLEQYANQTNSWWYELWGNDADGFTAVDFLKLIIYFEMSGKADGDSVGLAGYAYAISEKMSMICAAQSSSGSCGGLSDNAIFNYLTSRASAWVRYDGLYWYGKSLDPSSTNKSADVNARGATVWANFVVDSALAQLHPQGSNADWGNVLTLGKVTDVQGLANAPIGIKELYSPSGEGPYIYWRYGTEGDFLYLGSAEQLRHWER